MRIGSGQEKAWRAISQLLPKDFLKVERVFTQNENLIALRIETEETKALGRELWYVGEKK